MSTRRAATASAAISLIMAMGLGSGATAHAAPTPPVADPSAPPASAVPEPGQAGGTANTPQPTDTAATQPTAPSTSPTSAATTTVRVTPTATAPARPAAPRRLVYATTTVEVRAGATPSATKVGTLQRGNHVATRGEEINGWLPVDYKGQPVWVLSAKMSFSVPKPPAFTKQIVYSTHTAAVRASNNKNSAKLGDLKAGQHVATRGIARAGWTPVTFRGRPGWVPSWTITTKKPQPAPKPAPSRTIVYATTTVNVRSAPSTSAGKYGTLHRGYHLGTRGSAVNGWTPVNYGGRNGWVASRYLTTTRIPVGPSSAPHPTTKARIDSRCMTGLVICINKAERKLRLVSNGKVLTTLDARFGGEYNPTREGTFKIYRKSKNHVSTLYGSKMPYAMFFSGGQAVHYSSDFARRGYAGHSHGCVNIRDMKGLQYLWNKTPVGTKVVVHH